ncbi:MAG: hypothetical protein IMZ69_04930 [Spirochaetes bacterium]|nr:hypothetical protein [Spirochaetota bacterium]
MSNLSTCAEPARPLPLLHPREHVEGDPKTLQELTRHLEAIERQAARVPSDTLRRLMAVELAGARNALRRLAIVREDLLLPLPGRSP